jgi:Tfp pilus assembly protein PilN
MIKVNLSGTSRKKRTKATASLAMPTSVTPILLAAIFLGSIGGGYWWYSTLTGQAEDLSIRIRQAEAQKAQLEAVIKQDQVYEARKKMLENRIKVIQDLQANQVSPVVALDALSRAVDRTNFVWLSSLDQNNSILSMSGMGTSLLAIADFYTNLQSTGYFRNIDVANAQDSAGNFTFSLKCEFAPPGRPQPAESPAPTGAN